MKKGQDKDAVLKDTLNAQTLEKLKMLKQDAVETEEKNRKEALVRKEEERRLREKNKSFEELLNESNLDWKKYKN
ncbi:YqkE family protein [Jeotgalibacillus haloalkalitolerans]|uniref:YqkE family protein n=1 Tax=Jeotgalibacillus haloalkalitolerans TaxID=3104292 RepID=A0ABU5KLE0_9BACL|nr:YqkE family protein [Jeotgalibacillus sp. HH7-29]MDZ5712073.1 YqkE family protein [Jeotgalibacillus sp. HH7-29]